MFSRRLQWDDSQNPLTRARLDLERGGARVLDLTVSNPTAVGLEYPLEDLRRALAGPDLCRYEPHPRGLRKAREAVSRYCEARGFAGDAGNIHLVSGSSEAYSWLFKLLTDPGDQVLLPRPSYPLFEYLAGLEHLQSSYYSLRDPGGGQWDVDSVSLDLAMTERSKLLIAVNPNNPTGSYLSSANLEMLVSFCKANDLALVVDEVFFDYALDAAGHSSAHEYLSALGLNADIPVFVISGFSKLLGMPQLKLGWIATSAPDAVRDDILSRLDFIADAYLSVNSPVQQGAEALFGLRETMQSRILGRCRENLSLLETTLDSHPQIKLLKPQGGWSAVLAARESGFALRLLHERHVYVHPGHLYDFPDDTHIVVSLLTSPDIFRDGMAKLLETKRTR